MSRPPHLLRVDADPDVFAPLIAAANAAGLRIGWLELTAPSPPSPLPPTLESAAAAGAMRAVAAGGGRSAAVKPLRGEPVLRDLLRAHFAGCALVLVRGGVAAPRLERLDPSTDASGLSSEVWRLDLEGPVRATTAELIARLRKPRLS